VIFPPIIATLLLKDEASLYRSTTIAGVINDYRFENEARGIGGADDNRLRVSRVPRCANNGIYLRELGY
jgi:hypothetical protein